MTSIYLVVNLFENSLTQTYTKEDATIEILLMLIGSFILGFLFCHFLGSIAKKEFIIKRTGNSREGIKEPKFEKETISNIKDSDTNMLSQDIPAKVIQEKKTTSKTKKENSPTPSTKSKKSATNESPKKATPLPEKKNSTMTPERTVKDDLKVIEGIGPAIEKLLNDQGILNFQALAEAPIPNLKKILDDAGPRFRVHVPETWADQAKLLRDGKMDEFKALTETLKGGRKR